MERKEKIEKYKQFLCVFCNQSAFLEDALYRIEKGETVSEKEMATHLELLEHAKESLLRMKDELGFSGGLDFTDNCNFYGFKYENGRLSGDYTKLPDIVLPWVREFDETRFYTYEVGMLLLFHHMTQEKRRKKEARCRRFKRMRQKVWTFVKNVFYTFLRVREEDFSYE